MNINKSIYKTIWNFACKWMEIFSGFNRELKIKTKLRCPFKEAIIVATTPKQEQNKYKTVIIGRTN